jgi:hypothetical protein
MSAPFKGETAPTPSGNKPHPLDSTQDPAIVASLSQASTLSESLPSAETRGYISFIINVHDWTHPGESADTILRLVDLFEKYGVRGDFYFTAEVTRQYMERRPDVIARLKNSNMTVSYHVRPPHPLYSDFDSRLQNLDDTALSQILLDYETFALDLETGDLDRSRAGGYTYVAQTFGRKPVAVPAPNDHPQIKDAAQRVYAGLGGQMTLLYHEEGTKIETPFEFVNGLLVRPSDFSITRAQSGTGENFWWNKLMPPNGNEERPLILLETALADWIRHGYGRPPFITSLIHENNFSRSGAEGWTSIYFSIDHGQRGDPLSPPYDLNAPDPSSLRPQEEQQAIWDAYEEMIAYAAENLAVVTSEDIVRMAQNP